MQDAVSKAINKAGVNMTPHGLRKLFAMEVVLNLYLGKYMELDGKGFSPHQIVGTIDDNSIITYASQQLGHRFQTTTLKHYIELNKLKLLKMSDAMRHTYLERRKSIAHAAFKQYQAESPGDEELQRSRVERYLLAEKDGLLKELRRGDKDKVFQILQNHLLN